MAKPVAVITGASSGIGLVFARRLARDHDLVLVARRWDKLEQAARELTSTYGTKVDLVQADLTVDEDLMLVTNRIAREPHLALLINNAGFGAGGPFWETSLEVQEEMHRLHILATLRLTHIALRNMVANSAANPSADPATNATPTTSSNPAATTAATTSANSVGNAPANSAATAVANPAAAAEAHAAAPSALPIGIVNVASVAAFLSRAGSVSYGSTKAWMTSFTESLAMDLKAAGSPIRVQALCPGYTYSEFHDTMGIDRTKLAGSALWMTAESVVDASLAGLAEGRLYVVPGWRYRALVAILPRLPVRLRMALLSAGTKQIGKGGTGDTEQKRA
jgi:short-subunit dehydrogenase